MFAFCIVLIFRSCFCVIKLQGGDWAFFQVEDYAEKIKKTRCNRKIKSEYSYIVDVIETVSARRRMSVLG